MRNVSLSEITDKGYFLQAIQRIFVGEYQRSRRFQFSCQTCLGFFDSEGAKHKFTRNSLDLNKNIALVRTQIKILRFISQDRALIWQIALDAGGFDDDQGPTFFQGHVRCMKTGVDPILNGDRIYPWQIVNGFYAHQRKSGSIPYSFLQLFFQPSF